MHIYKYRLHYYKYLTDTSIAYKYKHHPHEYNPIFTAQPSLYNTTITHQIYKHPNTKNM